MSSIIQEEFEHRQEDIDLIIELINFLSNSNSIIVHPDNEEEHRSYSYDSRLISTLSGVISLMTYNQIESTMRGCLEALYDDMTDNNIHYHDLKVDIQKTILDGIVKNYPNGNLLHGKVGAELTKKLPLASLNIRKVFNGNIDSQKIYKIRDTYGISFSVNPALRNGVEITSFKDARNDLAHGNISFSKYGNDNPYTEVIDKSGRVSGYLRAIISGFDSYIEEKKYKS
ncbi:hypothetical protein DA099_17225 [Photobacterium damselae]|uniref:Uncharacterized protein n=3 Tax=Photobacterium damselae TaxID=38293 RepID=A0ACD3T037_PHODM|nr:MAE_28990/MAE_18760 family HEPN-like nuclease [Photobacterium damselae]RDL28810.1 hypothetical protein BC461_02500 [Photobacterium damselae]TMX45746.1 hypothetical protein DA099_17225 [Photobacterium damselae]TMX73273.1 hypothetical protein DA092_14580 [Photobacterium damselae]TMX73345.1 hypothetical protein DA092_13845 [Photobacterium damselae]TMX74303.1 hypothetical protein DA092_12540 [Photobacterium damselae]